MNITKKFDKSWQYEFNLRETVKYSEKNLCLLRRYYNIKDEIIMVKSKFIASKMEQFITRFNLRLAKQTVRKTSTLNKNVDVFKFRQPNLSLLRVG